MFDRGGLGFLFKALQIPLKLIIIIIILIIGKFENYTAHYLKMEACAFVFIIFTCWAECLFLHLLPWVLEVARYFIVAGCTCHLTLHCCSWNLWEGCMQSMRIMNYFHFLLFVVRCSLCGSLKHLRQQC